VAPNKEQLWGSIFNDSDNCIYFGWREEYSMPGSIEGRT
jgi:hypothetical protein